MEMSKPTALATAKQHVELLGGISSVDKGGSPGRTLAQLTVPSLRAPGDVGEVDANQIQFKELKPLGGGNAFTSPIKPLKVLNEPRTSGDGRGSSPRKLVAIPSTMIPTSPLESTGVKNTNSNAGTTEAQRTASPRVSKVPRQSSLMPLALMNNDNQGKRGEDDCSSKANDVVPKEEVTNRVLNEAAPSNADHDTRSKNESEVTGTKCHNDANKSDDEEFNFDDSDGENEGVKPATLAEEDESPSPAETKMRSAHVDIEDLYYCPPDTDNENTHREQYSAHKEPKMFLPRASDLELFHVVLMEDTDRLEQFLEEISPQEMLEIVDIAGRTLYHYAALSRDKLVQDMTFQHVNSYHDAQFEIELQALMRKKAQMWMQDSESNGKGWIPPRVKELKRETKKQKCSDWKSICSSVDENGRTFFHYIATTTSLIIVDDDYEFCSVLRTHPNILSTKDKFKKLALHYAVETGNLKQVKWYFQMGIKLNQVDVDLLLSMNVSRVMENVILRQLEAIDIQKYYLPTSKHGIDENDDRCDPGVSTFALAKLQRTTKNNVGHLHQLPLHRAAMFGNIRAVELLLEDGADPSVRDANGWTPLHYCADEATDNHLAIAQLLMESPKPVHVNAKSLKGRSPLHVAVRTRKRRIPRSDDDSHPTEVFESADRLAFVSYLHECKADLNLKDKHEATPLLLASRRGSVGVAQFLLHVGCDPTATGDNKWNPLHFAAIRGNLDMVKFLLSWDADSWLWIDSPGIHGRKPIDVAKNNDVRQMLVNLWTECYSGNVDQVRRLLLACPNRGSRQSVGSVSVKDKTAQKERTPLHLAARVLGYMDTLQLRGHSSTLVSSREERLKQEKISDLKRSAPSRFLQIAVLLLQAGASLCAADKWGITPLMLASIAKDAIFMETLLDRSGEDDPLVADRDGNTALHYSYAFCQAQISTMLEDQMDDADIENKQGKTPFEMTGYYDKIYPREYREFQKQLHNLKKRQS